MNLLKSVGGADLTSLAKASEVMVKVPVSYTYNGGVLVDGAWYAGFDVGPPVVPATHELVDMACGLDLNHRPPCAAMILRPKR
jgi:hypothetical protein